MSEKQKYIVKIVGLILAAVLSFTFVGNWASSVKTHKDNIEYLDTKRNQVLALTTVSTTASVAITLAPGDAGTSIADSLADLSNKFIVIIGAIYLEKYLLTLTGFVAFKALIPMSLLMLAWHTFKNNVSIKNAAIKLMLVAVVMFATVPTGILLSSLVEDTYQESIAETIDEAKEATKKAEKAEEKNLWDKIVDGVSSFTTGIVNKFTGVLNNLIEAFAVMIVTSCIIPILVMMFFAWGIKMVIGIEIDTSKIKDFDGVHRMNRSLKKHQTNKHKLKTPTIKE